MIRITTYFIGIYPMKMNHPLYRHIEWQSDKQKKANALFLCKPKLSVANF